MTVSGVTTHPLYRTEAAVTTTGTTPPPAGEVSAFETALRSNLAAQSATSLSEEDLFAAVIEAKLAEGSSAEAATAFTAALESEKNARRRPDGKTSVEESAEAALLSLVAEGTLTEETALAVREEAFSRAQLDDNKSALFDSHGSEGDPTIAVASREDALTAALLGLTPQSADPATDDGSAPSDDPSTEVPSEVTPQGTAVDGPDGFLFKPASDSDGRLVVLLPESLSVQVVELALYDSEGNEIESGRYAGNANGERDHYRFSKGGDQYPKDIKVVAALSDGTSVTYTIPNPAERYD